MTAAPHPPYRREMRPFAAFAVLLAACSPDALPVGDDAAPDVALDAAAVDAPPAQPDAAPDVPCGGACGPGTVCTLGRCLVVPDAPAEDVAADVLERDVARDAAPETSTDAGELADVGRLGDALVMCAAGLDDCNGFAGDGCETPLNTTANCGACGVACMPNHAQGRCSVDAMSRASCVIGGCSPGYRDCDGNVANGCECNSCDGTRCAAP